jgi:hypothetical protein
MHHHLGGERSRNFVDQTFAVAPENE